MKPKLFVFCSGCGSFEKEIKTKKELIKYCPKCGLKLRGLKIPIKIYNKAKKDIEGLGIAMWFGIEDMFKETL